MWQNWLLKDFCCRKVGAHWVFDKIDAERERERERESYAVDENKSKKCYESGEAKVADNLLIF